MLIYYSIRFGRYDEVKDAANKIGYMISAISRSRSRESKPTKKTN